jgi:hypothetical protein
MPPFSQPFVGMHGKVGVAWTTDSIYIGITLLSMQLSFRGPSDYNSEMLEKLHMGT